MNVQLLVCLVILFSLMVSFVFFQKSIVTRRAVISAMPAISPLRPVSRSPVSFFRCFGNEKNELDMQGRGCWFENLCYHPQHDLLYYQPVRQPILWNERTGPVYTFGTAFVPLTQFDHQGRGNTFAPKVVSLLPEEMHPDDLFLAEALSIWSRANWSRHDVIHLLWKPWSVIDANLGHLLWEEMGSLFYTMERFGLVVEKQKVVVLIRLEELPEYYLFRKILDAFMPVLGGPYVLYHDYVPGVAGCLHHVIAGGIEPVFLPGSNNLGKEALFASFRNAIIHKFGLEDHHPMEDHPIPPIHIIVTRKAVSFAGLIRRTILNVDEIYDFIKREYSNNITTVEVVDWSQYSFQEQVKKMLQTSVIVTPCGGVSMMLPFLPRGAYAIITDFWSSEAKYGFPVGISASMEAPFWNAWPHFKRLYYQVWEGEYEMDVEGTKDTRDFASIRVDLGRLKKMLDGVIELLLKA